MTTLTVKSFKGWSVPDVCLWLSPGVGGGSLALTLCELQAPFFVSSQYVMHQSFVSPDPSEPGNSGAFNFSIFKALLKALHCGAKFVVKSLINAPAPGA